MMRRLAPVLLALGLAAIAAADLPPWLQPAARPPAGAPQATPAVAPAPADAATFGELLALLLSPEDAATLREDSEERRAAWLAQHWERLAPHQQAQVRFAGERLREPGGVANARALTLLVLGPPQAMHSEPERDWTGTSIDAVRDLRTLRLRLLGEPSSPAPTLALEGRLPTEIWVYPTGSLNELRVLSFVDEDGDGSFRFAGDRVAPVHPPASDAPAVEPPAELFAPGDVDVAAALPALVKPGLPLKTDQVYFKASAGRTFARFLVGIDPSDVDLELNGDAAAFAATATAFVRVEKNGVPAWQGSAPLAGSGATAEQPWLVDLSHPLLPGRYRATALVVDAAGAGGTSSWDIDVPTFTGRLSVSTPVVARAVDGNLPPATSSEGDELAPFQVGNFIMRPVPGGLLRRGDSAAFAVQVYGDVTGATIEYDMYADGVYQSSLEPTPIKALPSTQITIQPITDAFRAGPYELRATVKGGGETVQVKFPFRVRG